MSILDKYKIELQQSQIEIQNNDFFFPQTILFISR